jgi:hypothetical protein
MLTQIRYFFGILQIRDFTNEITKEKGEYIVEQVAVGEKFYSYITNNGYTHALCRGVSFNNLTSILLNFDSMKEMVIENPFKEINVEQLYFIRNKREWSIKTEVRNKKIFSLNFYFEASIFIK